MLFLNSPAKLNLYLEVINTRKDKYHNIKTVFERIDLSDKIILNPRCDKTIRITSDIAGFPCGSANLAYRAARLLQANLKIKRGVDIKIFKRIPVGAGLGGGSSNAASVLMGLNKLWGLNLRRKELVKFAASIGSDAPFFIYNSPFAQGTGRGDKITPLSILDRVRLWHVLVVPKIKVLTPLIYKKWDKNLALTRPIYNAKILILALKKKDFFLISKALFNSLEEITAKLYPQVKCLRDRLLQMRLQSISMSGSGPAVFGIVSSRKEAVAISRQLAKANKAWRVFVTKTV